MAKKTLLFVFCLCLIAGITSAQKKVGKVIDNWKYEIPKTTVAPVIDGIQDPVWKTVDWVFQRSYTNGTQPPDDWADLMGVSKLMYDDENLYGIFYAQDESPYGDDAAESQNWVRNAIELYLDGDNSKIPGPSVTLPDHHLTFRHEHIGDEANSDWDVETGLDSTGLEWKIRDDETMIGYWLEFKVPLVAVDMPNSEGSVVGVEWQQDDNDGAGRESISKWWLMAGDSSWQFASTWGTGVLSDRVVSDKFEINKLPAGKAPVVDGDFDNNIYLNANSISTNCFGNISATSPFYPDDYQDAFITLWLVYDDDNLYGFFRTYDDDPYGNDAAITQNWQRNAVELYLDGDNSKIPGPSVTAPDHHLTFRHEHIDDEANSDWDVETGLDSTGIEWKIKDVTDPVMGYNVEFKIPLAALDMPNSEGSVVGLEMQQDDNDGNGRDVVTKWWEEQGDSSWQFASTWGTAVLGKATVVDVRPEPVGVAKGFTLSQNYPNPFNPSTIISYSIPKSEKVRLSVYNVLGKEVAVLVNQTQNAGSYTVNFNAKDLSSGVYFYKLESGNQRLINKMIFLK